MSSTPTAHAPLPRTLILEACTKQLAYISSRRLANRHQAQEEKLRLIKQERDRKVLGLFPVKHATAPDEVVWEFLREKHRAVIFTPLSLYASYNFDSHHYGEADERELYRIRTLAEKCDGDHVHLTTEGVRLLRL